MTAQKDRIAKALSEIGAAWAVMMDKCVLPDDPLEDQINQRATYHIHPDASEPRVNYIQTFDSLKELESWIRDQRPPRRRQVTNQARRRLNVSLPGAWVDILKRKDGSFQAAIERLVRDELGELAKGDPND